METPSGATTETPATNADANGAANPGAESPPAAKGPSEAERINELTGNWRETQRDRDYWRDMALKGNANGQPRGRDESNGGEGGGEGGEDEEIKTLADFKYDEKAYGKYIRDLGRKDAERAAQKVRDEIHGERTEAEQRAAVSEFQDKARTWAKGQKLDAEVMFKSPNEGGPAISPLMGEAIRTSDHGPEILNYLARNTAESRRIFKLTPAAQGLEIGRLEAKFATGPTPKTDSGAPPPHETVKGASDTGTKKDPAQMTDEEWWQSKQRSERAKRAAAGAKK